MLTSPEKVKSLQHKWGKRHQKILLQATHELKTRYQKNVKKEGKVHCTAKGNMGFPRTKKTQLQSYAAMMPGREQRSWG